MLSGGSHSMSSSPLSSSSSSYSGHSSSSTSKNGDVILKYKNKIETQYRILSYTAQCFCQKETCVRRKNTPANHTHRESHILVRAGGYIVGIWYIDLLLMQNTLTLMLVMKLLFPSFSACRNDICRIKIASKFDSFQLVTHEYLLIMSWTRIIATRLTRYLLLMSNKSGQTW